MTLALTASDSDCRIDEIEYIVKPAMRDHPHRTIEYSYMTGGLSMEVQMLLMLGHVTVKMVSHQRLVSSQWCLGRGLTVH